MIKRIVLVVLAAALAAPAAASAGTVSRSGAVLMYTANAGERNSVIVEAASPTIILITDGGTGVDIADGSNCFPIDLSNPRAGAQCTVDPETSILTRLGDGDDRYLGEQGIQLPELVSGDTGNDVIDTADGVDAVDGGDGNDRISAGPGNDTVLGAAGNDLVRGDAGDDRLDGGPGTDRVDARTRGGLDRVDCTSGGDDAIIRGSNDELVECGAVPRARLIVPRQRVAAFFDEDGFEFSVHCARPCALRWTITARDRSTRRRIHERRGRLDFANPRRDEDNFPRYLEPGLNQAFARPIGRTSRRDIAAARRLRLRLEVTVIDRNSLETTLTRDLTIRR